MMKMPRTPQSYACELRSGETPKREVEEGLGPLVAIGFGERGEGELEKEVVLVVVCKWWRRWNWILMEKEKWKVMKMIMML